MNKKLQSRAEQASRGGPVTYYLNASTGNFPRNFVASPKSWNQVIFQKFKHRVTRHILHSSHWRCNALLRTMTRLPRSVERRLCRHLMSRWPLTFGEDFRLLFNYGVSVSNHRCSQKNFRFGNRTRPVRQKILTSRPQLVSGKFGCFKQDPHKFCIYTSDCREHLTMS